MPEVMALRERRRVQTETEIGDAALELFERHGFEATRVEDIAREAGISKRTFFRYFASKELAAVASGAQVEALVKELLGRVTPDRPLLRQLEEVSEHVLALYENGESDDGRRLLRAWRLFETEPALRAASAALRERRTSELVAILREVLGPETDDLEIEMAIAVWDATVCTALIRWVAARDAGDAPDLVETYAGACAVLRGLPEL